MNPSSENLTKIEQNIREASQTMDEACIKIMNSTTAINTSETTFILPYKEGYENGPLKLQRDEFGLLKNVDYKFTADGWVDWKAMINPKFLYPNKSWFERNNQPVPDSIKGLEDHQLLCKLGGYKELARLRGYSNVEYKLQYLENGVSAICSINWLPNYETLMQRNLSFVNGYANFSSIANSTSDNCGDFMAAFKETQAENRAFVRCVRNFLNVNIVGDDEISKGKTAEQEVVAPSAMNPQKNLEKLALSKGFNSCESLKKDLLLPNKFSPKEKPKTNWAGYADIPANECWRISTLLENNK